MNSRINITYSLNTEELPAETLRLWARIEKQVELLVSAMPTQHGEHIFSVESVEQIDLLRQQLGNIDYALSDVSNIIQGYMQYRTQPPTPVEEPSLDALAAKIKEFRNQESPE